MSKNTTTNTQMEKMSEHQSTAWLVNTGWSGGAYGVGKRMSLKITRAIIDAIFDGSLVKADYEEMPVFHLAMPKTIEGVDSSILNPRNTWEKEDEYNAMRDKLAAMFIKNFSRYTDNADGQALTAAGPKM